MIEVTTVIYFLAVLALGCLLGFIYVVCTLDRE